MNQLLYCFADHHRFKYEPAGGASGDRGMDGQARDGGVPGFNGDPVGFQFKWLWNDIHQGSNSQQIRSWLKTATMNFGEIKNWILVTPWDLKTSEKAWLDNLEVRRGVKIFHWGKARIEELMRDHCPSLFARY